MNLGDRKGLGDLYFFHWIVKFTQADRLEALSYGIRPKTVGQQDDFRPLLPMLLVTGAQGIGSRNFFMRQRRKNE